MGLLRFFLAFGVVVQHANLYDAWFLLRIFQGGYAVPVFFMISGFYMALILNTKYENTRQGNLAFYLTRYLRLWPTYIVVLAVLLWFRPIGSVWDISPSAQILVYFSAFSLFGYELLQWFAFNPSEASLYLNHTTKIDANHVTLDMLIYMRPMWSIGIEVWFYLLAPFMLRRFRRLLLLFGLALLAHLALVYWLPFHHPMVYRNFFNYLYLFLAGALGFYFYYRVLRGLKLSTYTLSYCLLFLFMLLFNFKDLMNLLRGFSGLDLRYCQDLLYLPVAALLPFVFQLTRRSVADRVIGDLSYPLYVAHWPVVNYFIAHLKTDPNWWFYAIFYSLFAALLLEFLVANPVDRLRHWLGGRMQKHAVES